MEEEFDRERIVPSSRHIRCPLFPRLNWCCIRGSVEIYACHAIFAITRESGLNGHMSGQGWQLLLIKQMGANGTRVVVSRPDRIIESPIVQ